MRSTSVKRSNKKIINTLKLTKPNRVLSSRICPTAMPLLISYVLYVSNVYVYNNQNIGLARSCKYLIQTHTRSCSASRGRAGVAVGVGVAEVKTVCVCIKFELCIFI